MSTFTPDQMRLLGAVEAALAGVYGPPHHRVEREPYWRLTWERGRSAYLEPVNGSALRLVVHGLDAAALAPLGDAGWVPHGPDGRARVAITIPVARLSDVAALAPIYKRWWRRAIAGVDPQGSR